MFLGLSLQIWEFSDEEEVNCTDYEDEIDSDNGSKASNKPKKNADELESHPVQANEGKNS